MIQKRPSQIIPKVGDKFKCNVTNTVYVISSLNRDSAAGSVNALMRQVDKAEDVLAIVPEYWLNKTVGLGQQWVNTSKLLEYIPVEKEKKKYDHILSTEIYHSFNESLKDAKGPEGTKFLDMTVAEMMEKLESNDVRFFHTSAAKRIIRNKLEELLKN